MNPHNRRGILTMMAAMLFFVTNDALVKLVSSQLPTPQLIFIRGAFATLLLVLMVVFTGSWAQWRSVRTRTVPIRALLDSAATFTYLTALFHLPLGNATAINLAAPLFLTLLAVVFLRERVGALRWALIVLGFTGVLLVVQPDAHGLNAYALLCVVGTLFHAGRDLMSVIGPFRYSGLLVALVLGYVLWGEVPNLLAWGGIALLVMAGLGLLHSQRTSRRAALDAATD